jgi:hypothetical protein
MRFCGPFHVISGKTRIIERREPPTRAAVIGRGGGWFHSCWITLL